MTSMFRRAEVTSAHLKMGLMGFAGSGKTFTATVTAIGLIEHMRGLKLPHADRPLFFLDTETGADWVKPRVEEAGIELYTAKTRAFVDLLAAVKEAEANASLLLIDSITHFWVELCDSYMRAKKRTRLQFEDWGYLKGEWRKFTDIYINSALHIILCGRAGYEYDYFEDEAGKKQLEKTDIKMKAEGEMGYEPSLLVLMERHTDLETMKAYRTATVLKDRATLIDGRQFRQPKFKDFLPHIKALNLGGRQLGVDTSRSSESSHPADVRDNNRVQRKIVLDEIESLIVLHHPGQAAADKKAKLELLRKHFNAAWTEMSEVMPLFDLRAGYDSLHQALEGAPSRYSRPTAPEPVEINDALPDCCAAPEPAEVTAKPKEATPPVAEPEPIVEPAPQQSRPDDGIPDFLRRKTARPPADVVDERAWLDKITITFQGVADFDSFKREHERLVKPQHERVSPAAWSTAVAIAQDALHRVTGVFAA